MIKGFHRTKMKRTMSVKKKVSEQNLLFITHFKVGIIAVDFHEKTMKSSHIVLFVPAHVETK